MESLIEKYARRHRLKLARDENDVLHIPARNRRGMIWTFDETTMCATFVNPATDDRRELDAIRRKTLASGLTQYESTNELFSVLFDPTSYEAGRTVNRLLEPVLKDATQVRRLVTK